jgi:hypothetical protein
MTATENLPATRAGQLGVHQAEIARLKLRVLNALRDNDLLGAMEALIALTDASLPLLADDVDALGHGITNLARLGRSLSALGDEAKKLARAWLDRHDVYKVPVVGVGVIKRDSGLTRTQWRHLDLMVEVVKRGFESGAISHPNEVPAFLLSVISSPSWKVGTKDAVTGEWSGLRGLGLDPADWCLEDRKATVSIEGAK